MNIVALGVRTPVGLRAESAAAAVRARISRLAEFPFLVGSPGELLIGARDPELELETPLHERLTTMAVSALEQVLRALPSPLPRVHVLLALPETRVGFSEAVAALLPGTLAARTEAWDVRWEQVGRGHAGACLGLQRAVDLLERRASDVCIVGGVDSYLDAQTLNALYEDRRLHTEDTRGGFPPGEGAGFVALATERVQRALRLPSLGVVRGVSTGHEPASGARADGLVEAVLGACAASMPGMILCDINGERQRAEEWGLLQLRIGERMRTSEYESPVSYWGDQGAASIPLLITLACRSWARGYAYDDQALVWAASESGLRGAVVIERPPS